MDGLTVKYDTIEVSGDSSRGIQSYVSMEKDVILRLNGIKVASLTMTPDDLKAFALGHLVCEGHIASIYDVKDLRIALPYIDAIAPNARKAGDETIAAGYRAAAGLTCDCAPLPDGPAVDKDVILYAASNMNDFAIQWRKTGGTHCSMIFDEYGGIISYAEDVGRHTSIDKTVGKALMDGRNLSRSFLVSTGRMPAAIVSKACRAKIPLVVSNTAPFTSGIEMAKKQNMTLICFARPPKMYVYSVPSRVGGIEIFR